MLIFKQKYGVKTMKNMTKIIIGIGLIFLIIGVASATDNNKIFNPPSGLQAVGTSSFVDQQGHNIDINDFTDENKKTWFENDTEPQYLVQKYNDTCYIGVDDENDCYILEIVEKDGNKYIVSSWTPKGPNETPIIQKNLEEFNKINQLTPLPIE